MFHRVEKTDQYVWNKTVSRLVEIHFDEKCEDFCRKGTKSNHASGRALNETAF